MKRGISLWRNKSLLIEQGGNVVTKNESGKNQGDDRSSADVTPPAEPCDENAKLFTVGMPDAPSVRLRETAEILDHISMQVDGILDDLCECGVNSEWREETEEAFAQYIFLSSDEASAKVATLAYWLGKSIAARESLRGDLIEFANMLDKGKKGRQTQAEESQKKADSVREKYAAFIAEGGKTIKDLQRQMSGVAYSSLATTVKNFEEEIRERARSSDCLGLSLEQKVARIMQVRSGHPGYTPAVIFKALSG
jgi:hypothetical protein